MANPPKVNFFLHSRISILGFLHRAKYWSPGPRHCSGGGCPPLLDCVGVQRLQLPLCRFRQHLITAQSSEQVGAQQKAGPQGCGCIQPETCTRPGRAAAVDSGPVRRGRPGPAGRGAGGDVGAGHDSGGPGGGQLWPDWSSHRGVQTEARRKTNKSNQSTNAVIDELHPQRLLSVTPEECHQSRGICLDMLVPRCSFPGGGCRVAAQTHICT